MTDYYAAVPATQRAELFAFRQAYPTQQFMVDGVAWDVLDTGGADKPALLILVGGLRVADAAYKTTAPLAQDFRVIVPTYPALTTMAALCDGIVGVLDALELDQAHLLAGSFGGMVAQVLVRRHSARISNMILSSTGIPDAGPYKTQRRMVAALPRFVLRRTLPNRMLAVMAVAHDQQSFWKAFLRELFTERLSKREVLATFDAILDFAENYTLSAADLEGWRGQLLIIQSDDDATFDAASREAVRKLYPDAQFHRFENAGHSPAQNQPDVYQRVVRAFLNR